MAIPYRLLFVCLGNICRSPAAENIMRKMIGDAQLSESIEIDSCGTTAYHSGSPPDRRMTASARRRGIEMTGAARPFRPEDFDKFDLIIAMDEDNRRDIIAQAGNLEDEEKVVPMAKFIKRFRVEEIPDPYYGGGDGFDRVLDLLEDGCGELLESIRSRVADSS